MGVDLSELDPDEPLGSNVKSNAIQSSVETFQKASGDDGNPWTIRQLAEWVGVGGFGPITVGSGPEVADKLIDWVDYTDVDGFNLAYAVTPATFEDVVEYVVPELQARGAYKSEYADGSLRNKLFGTGDRVKETHRAAKYKISNRLAAKS